MSFRGPLRVLALVLVLAVPSLAMAAPPLSKAPDKGAFNAVGAPTSIDDGKVKPLGTTGKWLVTDRHLKGQFVNGELSGPFTLTYGGVFKISDQSGNLAGTLDSGKDRFSVVGDTQPVLPVGSPYLLDGAIVLPVVMQASGYWTGLKNLKAVGDFNALIILAVEFDPATKTTGHVKAVLDQFTSVNPVDGKSTLLQSVFVMGGKYLSKH